jgi:hypothetical protein
MRNSLFFFGAGRTVNAGSIQLPFLDRFGRDPMNIKTVIRTASADRAKLHKTLRFPEIAHSQG